MNEQPNGGNKRTMIVIIIVVIIGSGVCGWYFLSYKPEQEAIEQARLAQIAQQQAEQKRIAQEAQKKERYDQLIVNADAAFDQEIWNTAQSLYHEASSLYANEQYPKDQLVIVNGYLDEIAEREARRVAGIVETVSSPTGRYYLIISSSIDSDLAMDYASKLAKEGASVRIIEHTANKLPFFGVSVADFDSWDQAMNAIPSYSNFGEGVWVLKF